MSGFQEDIEKKFWESLEKSHKRREKEHQKSMRKAYLVMGFLTIALGAFGVVYALYLLENL